jgi:hypothetical protein
LLKMVLSKKLSCLWVASSVLCGLMTLSPW